MNRQARIEFLERAEQELFNAQVARVTTDREEKKWERVVRGIKKSLEDGDVEINKEEFERRKTITGKARYLIELYKVICYSDLEKEIRDFGVEFKSKTLYLCLNPYVKREEIELVGRKGRRDGVDNRIYVWNGKETDNVVKTEPLVEKIEIDETELKSNDDKINNNSQ